MVWLVEKKVFHHVLDLGFERVAIPVRVKFEFEVKEGGFVSDTLAFESLYNRTALEKRYPNLEPELLDSSIDQAVRDKIDSLLKEYGYLKTDQAGEIQE